MNRRVGDSIPTQAIRHIDALKLARVLERYAFSSN
jgi:hypothetical protein